MGGQILPCTLNVWQNLHYTHTYVTFTDTNMDTNTLTNSNWQHTLRNSTTKHPVAFTRDSSMARRQTKKQSTTFLVLDSAA